jgi:hypothetical protein
MGELSSLTRVYARMPHIGCKNRCFIRGCIFPISSSVWQVRFVASRSFLYSYLCEEKEYVFLRCRAEFI